MKIAIDSSQQEFFENEHHLELEGVFSPEEMESLEEALTPGYDLWRNDSAVEKVVFSRRLAQIASQIFKQRPLRLGYDLYLPEQSYSIEGNGSIQRTMGGCLIHFSGNVTFVSPEYPFEFKDSFLIVYTHPQALFIRNQDDPYAHIYKDRGYSYGDRLSDVTNPIIYK